MYTSQINQTPIRQQQAAYLEDLVNLAEVQVLLALDLVDVDLIAVEQEKTETDDLDHAVLLGRVQVLAATVHLLARRDDVTQQRVNPVRHTCTS